MKMFQLVTWIGITCALTSTPEVVRAQDKTITFHEPGAKYLATLSIQGGPTQLLSFPSGGNSNLRILAGDFDGDGKTDMATFDEISAQWSFWIGTASAEQAPNFTYQYGWQGVLPLVGDWDADGKDEIGIFDRESARFFLASSDIKAFTGVADQQISFGGPGWTPIVGDWNGDGRTTVGAYDESSSSFYIRMDHQLGPDIKVPAPVGQWQPLIGDWDGNGVSDLGLANSALGLLSLGTPKGFQTIGVPIQPQFRWIFAADLTGALKTAGDSSCPSGIHLDVWGRGSPLAICRDLHHP